MTPQGYLWIVFAFVIVMFLVVDLGYLNRKAHRVSFKSALLQSIFWVTISLIFGGLVFWLIGHDKGAEFMTAYLTEKMLSVDNLFVIMLIFSYFKLEEKYHHKVLFWGILGAVVMRGVLITMGGVIVSNFHWVLYVFAVVLLYTGVKLFFDKGEEHADFSNHKVLRLAKKYLRFTTEHHGGHFTIKQAGKRFFTLLFMILIIVETTDLVFALDSIPAVFAISQDTFIVFTSNIFAVMGLRALFFLIENILHRFHHLQKGVAFVLIFIGAKMLVKIVGIEISSLMSLAVILFAFGASMILSVIFPKKI